MKQKHLVSTVLALMVSLSVIQAQSRDSIHRKYFVGSTLFVLANLVDDPEPPMYGQLNFGYRITPDDVISLELITWNYYEPLGVPYGQKSSAPNYPGRVHAFGAGLAYQRFIWKGAYAKVHSTLLRQNYLDELGNRIQSGYQLFNTIRIGYQFRFFKNRCFIEPSIAMTFWPINTNLPASFQQEENKWNKFFLGEPGVHFGISF